MLEGFIFFIIFIFGASIGSFLNVLIDRLPFERSIEGRSRCDHCHRQLSWFELIPVVSYLVQGGYSRCCHKKISFYYPLVEIITGLLFVLISRFLFPVFKSIFSIQYPISLYIGLANLGIISCLIVIFFADLKYQIIPDSIQAAFFIFALILLPFEGPKLFLTFAERSVAAILIAAPIFFIHFFSKGKAMGFGDVKLSFTIGFLLGIKAGFLALYFAFIFGGIVGLFLIIAGRKKLKSKIAFGPFLVLGIIIILFWQREIFQLINKIYSF